MSDHCKMLGRHYLNISSISFDCNFLIIRKYNNTIKFIFIQKLFSLGFYNLSQKYNIYKKKENIFVLVILIESLLIYFSLFPE